MAATVAAPADLSAHLFRSAARNLTPAGLIAAPLDKVQASAEARRRTLMAPPPPRDGSCGGCVELKYVFLCEIVQQLLDGSPGSIHVYVNGSLRANVRKTLVIFPVDVLKHGPTRTRPPTPPAPPAPHISSGVLSAASCGAASCGHGLLFYCVCPSLLLSLPLLLLGWMAGSSPPI